MPTNEIDLFSWNLEPKKIKKKVRIIELFAGIGAQAKSLEILGVDFEHYKIVEWAVPSIIAYNSIHIKDTTDYSENKTSQEMLERIKGVSTNYNEPIAFEKLKSKPIERIKNVYNNCIATHNLINIMDVKGKDLEIVDKDKYEYILTYSFPCQDLSLAGKRAGMSVSQSEGGTRSGLLWEVARILNELEKEKALPQILLCENVAEIMSEKSMKDLQKWVSALEKLGYKSYDTILNAKNYGLPQNRRRFFMISILGEYSYEFPSPIALKWKLKDFLEKEVDEKYYLSEKMVEYISATNEKWTGNNNGAPVNRDIACTINTAPGQRRCDSSNYIADNLPDNADLQVIPIKNNTKKGFLLAEEGDAVDISGRMQYHRGTVQKGITQSITTIGGDNVGVVIKERNAYTDLEKSLFTKDGNIKRYVNSDIVDEFKEGQMATTSYPNGYGHGTRVHDESISLTTNERPSVKCNLRIRKLTPKECMRLMGFQDKDTEAMYNAGLSNNAIYHCAGDSICVNVLMAIFSPLFDKDWRSICQLKNF